MGCCLGWAGFVCFVGLFVVEFVKALYLLDHSAHVFSCSSPPNVDIFGSFPSSLTLKPILLVKTSLPRSLLASLPNSHTWLCFFSWRPSPLLCHFKEGMMGLRASCPPAHDYNSLHIQLREPHISQCCKLVQLGALWWQPRVSAYPGSETTTPRP